MSEPQETRKPHKFRIISIIVVVTMLMGAFGFLVGPIMINVSAATIEYTWNAPAAGVASLNTNWDPNGVPDIDDVVYFDATSNKACTWDIQAVGVFWMLAGFTNYVNLTNGFTSAGQIRINSGTLQLYTYTVYCGGTWYAYYGNVTYGTSTLVMNNAGSQISPKSETLHTVVLNATSGVYVLGNTLKLGIAIGSGLVGKGATLYIGGNDILGSFGTNKQLLYGSGTLVSMAGTGELKCEVRSNPSYISFSDWVLDVDVFFYTIMGDNYRAIVNQSLNTSNHVLKPYGGAANQRLIFDANGSSISCGDFLIGTYGKVWLKNSHLLARGWFDTYNATEFSANQSTVSLVGDLPVGQNYIRMKATESLNNLAVNAPYRMTSSINVTGLLTINGSLAETGKHIFLPGNGSSVTGSGDWALNNFTSEDLIVMFEGGTYLSVDASDTVNITDVTFIGQSVISGYTPYQPYTYSAATEIVGIGDSMMSVDYTADLANLLWATVTNKGVGGEETDLILARFDTDVIALAPDYVVIEAGFNDILYPFFDIEDSKANLQAMYDMATGNGIKVVALTTAPYVGWNYENQTEHIAINDWIKAQANSTVYVVDICSQIGKIGAPWEILAAYLSGDNLHPNAAGYLAMATWTFNEAFRLRDVPVYSTELLSAKWNVSCGSDATISFTLSGLDSGLGYRIYQDGIVIAMGYGPSFSFTAMGGGEFEVQVWYPASVSRLVVLTVNMLAMGLLVGVVGAAITPLRNPKNRNPEKMMKVLLNVAICIIVGVILITLVNDMFIGG